jgi:hypothetical protein
VDRHEHIGEGHLSRSGFEPLVNDERFRDIPGILETPPLEDGSDSFESGLLTLRSYVHDGRDPPTMKTVALVADTFCITPYMARMAGDAPMMLPKEERFVSRMA